MTDAGLERTMESLRDTVEAAMERHLLPAGTEVPEPLAAAMRYAVFPGGKRLRPVLALMTCRALGGADEAVLPAAVALELIHCYSLVHDDLPAMDDDDLRRGRPTCHKAHGEAVAILAGDALLTRAFEVVAGESPSACAAALTREIAAASGAAGMVGGQAVDLLSEGLDPDAERVEWIHRHKTGELLRVSVRTGAVAAGGTAEQVEAADQLGADLGLAFQIVDDLLGRSGTEGVTGKPVGKDDERGKQTYPAAVGEDRARRRVDELTERALESAARFPRSEELRALAVRLKERVA